MVVNYKTVPLTRNNKLVFFLSPNENGFTEIYQFTNLRKFYVQESSFLCKNNG